MKSSTLRFVNSATLERVEAHLAQTIRTTGAQSVLLIDRSGVVLATAGETPLHPDLMGATGAGVFGAMGSMIKASRTDEFSISIPANNAQFYFQAVDRRLFLLAFFTDPASADKVRAGLKELASEAVESLSQDSVEPVDGSVNFITEKLNELFKQ